jgi:hypothetical protein
MAVRRFAYISKQGDENGAGLNDSKKQGLFLFILASCAAGPFVSRTFRRRTFRDRAFRDRTFRDRTFRDRTFRGRAFCRYIFKRPNSLCPLEHRRDRSPQHRSCLRPHPEH